MKIAVLFSGHIRTFKLCEESILNFFKPLNAPSLHADFFVSTYDKKYELSQSLNLVYKEIDLNIIDIPKIYNNFNLTQYEIHSNDKLKHIFTEEYEKFDPNMKHVFEQAFLQYYKLNLGVSMIDQYALFNNIKYDVLIKIRNDVVLKSNENLNLSNIKTSIILGYNDTNNNSYILNDQLLITSFSNFKNLLLNIMEEFYNMKCHLSSKNIPHGILSGGIHKTNLNIEKQSLVSHIVRLNDIITHIP